jgi:ubiquinone/menaquinone biosynthesis C-methylase UbiE
MNEIFNASYEPFSREPEYVEVNRLFIESLGLSTGLRVLDLACGTGTLTAIILTELHAKFLAMGGHDHLAERQISVIGVDICPEALKLADRYLADIDAPGRKAVVWLEAAAEWLPVAPASVDAVIIGNAIQLFENKEAVLRELSRVLVGGGLLAFNTSFYAGTFAPGTEKFYLRWVQEAVKYIQEKDMKQRRQGLGGIPRIRGLAKPAFSNPWLSRFEYERLLVRNQFAVNKVNERTITLTRHGFETIGSYAGLATVLLSGYPVELACEALGRSAGVALSALGVERIPRYWIEFIAVKS